MGRDIQFALTITLILALGATIDSTLGYMDAASSWVLAAGVLGILAEFTIGAYTLYLIWRHKE